jgi:hypothetical protein
MTLMIVTEIAVVKVITGSRIITRIRIMTTIWIMMNTLVMNIMRHVTDHDDDADDANHADRADHWDPCHFQSPAFPHISFLCKYFEFPLPRILAS